MAVTAARRGRPDPRRNPKTVVICCAFCRKPTAKFDVTWADTFHPRVKARPHARVVPPWEEAVGRPRRLIDYRLWCSRATCQTTYVLEGDCLESLLVHAARARQRRAMLPKQARLGSLVPRVFDPSVL